MTTLPSGPTTDSSGERPWLLPRVAMLVPQAMAVVARPDGRVLAANRAWTRLIGGGTGDRPATLQAAFPDLASALPARGTGEDAARFRMLRVGGAEERRIWCDLHLAPHPDAADAIVVTAQDVTETVLARRAADDARQALDLFAVEFRVRRAGRQADFLAEGGELGALMRAREWASTPLGPPETWPQSLRTSVSTCLNCAFPLLLWWGPELVKLYNDAYAEILGAKHPAALGAPGRTVWPEIWDIIGPMLDQVMTEARATRAEDLLLMLQRRGYAEECYFSFSYSPIRDETGGVGGVFCPVVETTERVIGERRLRLLRRLAEQTTDLHSAAEACAIAATCLAEDAAHDLPFAAFYLVEADGGSARLAGAAGSSPGSPGCPETIRLDGADACPWPVADMLAGRAARCGPIDPAIVAGLPTGPWQRAPADGVVIPMGASGPRPFGIMVAGLNPHRPAPEVREFTDMVARQVATAIDNAAAYQAERNRAEALAALDRAKTVFFSNISHEFRTPLTLTLAPLEDALNDRSAAVLHQVQRDRLEAAHRNGLRLLRLVNTLLDFSRIEAGRTVARFVPVDLAAFTADVASCFRPVVERAGLAFDIACPPLAEPVFVDRDMWEKVLLNLLANAFKFTFAGRIAVTLGASDGRAVLSVRDTGVGIPRHELAHVFERFHRIEGQRSRSFEGSGIGLALVHELVRLHGGTITAESEPDRGSIFTVALQFGAAHLPHEQVHGEAAASPAPVLADAFVQEALRWLPEQRGDGAEPLAPQPGSGRPTVLLADDNADMRQYVRRLLGEEYDVIDVADGRAALETIGRQRPDLVLSDVMMPGLDGLGLVRAIRSDPAIMDLPVLLLSARAGEEARVEGLAEGADDYVTKPFSAHELRARVRTNLALARRRREAVQAVAESEAVLRALTEAAPLMMGTVELTGDGDILHLYDNLTSCAFFGVPPGGTAGRTARALGVSDDTVAIWRAHYDRSAETGEPVRFDYPHPRDRFGQERMLAVTVAPLLGAISPGRPRLCYVAEDVTDRRRAERELARSEARLRHTLESLPQIAWLLRLDGTAEFQNRRVAEYAGYEVGPRAEDRMALVHADDRARMAPVPARAAAGSLPDGEVRLRRHDGEWRWHRLHAVQIEPRSGTDAAWIESAVDIHDLKQAERALADANAQLEARVAERTRALAEAANELAAEMRQREAAQSALLQSQKLEVLGQLTSGVAHDFNNILAAVLGSYSLIRRRTPSTEIHEIVARGEQAADRGARLIAQMMAFARKEELRPAAVDLAAVIRGARDMVCHTVGSGTACCMELSDDTWPVIVDPVRMETVVLNLAANARDAMPGGGRLTIGLRNALPEEVPAELAPTREWVLLSVADNGTGMDGETLRRATEPFFTTKPARMGTGLGLASAAGFARNSGGALRLHSTLGAGTTVELFLPRAGVTVTRAADRAEQVAVARPAPGAAASILLVDDDEGVRAVTAGLLRDLGYTVVEAASAEAAEALAHANHAIGLLVTDVLMPGVPGPVLAARLRAERPELPVLYITAHSGDVGLDAPVLGKPFTDAALARAVAGLLGAVGT